MRWTSSLVMVLSIGLSVFAAEPKDPRSLDVPVETTAKAKALIAKLDDSDILVQDRLTAQLMSMGRDALPALLEAQKGKPAKRVLDRVTEVLPAARQADFATRYPLFLADKDRKYDHDLPGWNDLKAAVKDTKASRAIMATILGDDECREMLLGAFDHSDAGRAQFARRWRDKDDFWWAEFRAGRQPNGHQPKDDEPICWAVASLLADLLSDGDYRSYERVPVIRSYTLTDEGKLAMAGKGPQGEVFLPFARFWIEKQSRPFGVREATWLARELKFDAAFVRWCLEREFDAAVARGERSTALSQLAYTKDPKYIASFRRLFEMETLHSTPQFTATVGEIQERDAALSMCIALSGQDPMEYGFSAQKPQVTAKDDARYWVDNYYFKGEDGKSADDKRKAAFKKWAEWEKANPDAIKAKPPEKKDK